MLKFFIKQAAGDDSQVVDEIRGKSAEERLHYSHSFRAKKADDVNIENIEQFYVKEFSTGYGAFDSEP